MGRKGTLCEKMLCTFLHNILLIYESCLSLVNSRELILLMYVRQSCPHVWGFFISRFQWKEILFKQMANKPLSPQLLSKFNNIANYRAIYVNPFMCLLHIFNVTSQRYLWKCWAMAAKLHPDNIPPLSILLRPNLLGFLLAIRYKN